MDDQKRVIADLLFGAKSFRRADGKEKTITWYGWPEKSFRVALACFLRLKVDPTVILDQAILQLKETRDGKLNPPDMLPQNLKELIEGYNYFGKKTKEKTVSIKDKEAWQEWVEELGDSYQLELAKKGVKPIRAKAKTFRVIIPKKREKETKKEKEAKSAVEELRAWIEERLIRSLPSLREEEGLRKDMATGITRMFGAYLPELSVNQVEDLSAKDKKVIAATGEYAIIDFLAFQLADEAKVKGLKISGPEVGKIIDDLAPDSQFPHTFSRLLRLLALSKEERFPEEYTGPRRAALEEAEGGLTLLFLPERVRLAVLKAVTYPLVPSLRENPEAALSLTDPDVIDPDTNKPITIRKKIQNLITIKGISPQSYQTIRALTKEVRSLRLLSLGITPEVLSQAIAQQLANGATETSPVVKILTILYDDLVGFETKIGFPIKLIKARARFEKELEQARQPTIQVGLQQVQVPRARLKAYQGWRALVRKRVLDWGTKQGIYEVKAEKGERVRVENRLLRPITRPIRAVFRRAVRPVLARLGRTAVGRTVKAAWGKVKSTAAKTIWKISKKGLKKVAKEGIKLLTTKLAATKIGAALGSVVPVIGNAVGAAIGFAIDVSLGLLKKAGKGIFKFFSGLISEGSKKGQRVAYGFGDFMYQLTSGEAFFGKKDRSLVFIFIGIFVLLPVLLIFLDTSEATAWLEELVPTETRYLGPPADLPGRLDMESQELSDIFAEAAQNYCVPVEILLAISQMEASGVWGYTKDQVENFSTPDWWDDAGCVMSKKIPGNCTNGYCYDTCKVTSLCPAYSVVGPMQFEKGTWDGYVARLKQDLSHEPHRCNLRDSIFAAAMKIKTNSGTAQDNCTGWDDDLVWSVARAYCGSCGVEAECGPNPTAACENQHKACGQNYCAAVVILYNEYKE